MGGPVVWIPASPSLTDADAEADLWILPSLLPPAVQTALLERLLHQHLGDPLHATNLDLHYRPAPASPPPAASWFSLAPDGAALVQPKDEAVHKALSPRQVLQRRLHWLTLGGQYDWSERAYPAQAPPPFPPELAAFLQTLFPQTEAQAAIVNLYSPGDSMMMHRDVSEQSDRGLISLSFGCDGLFMVAPDADPDAAPLLFRLRSGDALYMSGQSRYAWHGVPKVLAGTCPDYLDHWPAHEGRFDPWRGWLAGKRVNLNVRQMRNL